MHCIRNFGLSVYSICGWCLCPLGPHPRSSQGSLGNSYIHYQLPASSSYLFLPNGFLWLQECYTPQLKVVSSSGGGW